MNAMVKLLVPFIISKFFFKSPERTDLQRKETYLNKNLILVPILNIFICIYFISNRSPPPSPQPEAIVESFFKISGCSMNGMSRV